MFKVLQIISVLTVIFLTVRNSYSQEEANIRSLEITTAQILKDSNPNAGIFKIHNSRQTQFDNVTVIEFELGEEANVLLTVCDLKGNIIETLINDLMDAGNFKVHYKSLNKIISGELTYKLEVKGISGIKNVFAVK